MAGDPMIRFACGTCGKKYRVPAEAAGKKTACRDCGEMLRVPAPSAKGRDDDAIGLLDDEPDRPKPRPRRQTASTTRSESPRRSSTTGGGRPRPETTAAAAATPDAEEPFVLSDPVMPRGARTPGLVEPDPPIVWDSPHAAQVGGQGGGVSAGDVTRYAKPVALIGGVALLVVLALMLITVGGSESLYLGLGWLLVIVGGIACLITGLWYLVAGFRATPIGMLLSFLPFVGGIISLIVLISHWEDLKRPFGANLLSVIVLVGGMFCLMMGGVELPDAEDPYASQRTGTYAGLDVDGRRGGNSSPLSRGNPGRSGFNSNPSPAPAPPPARPIFDDGQLTAGATTRPADDNDARAWPTFKPPVGVDLARAIPLEMHGYRVLLPEGYRLDAIQDAPRGGTEWSILGPEVNSRPVELTVRLVPVGLRADGGVLEPAWGEVLAAAGIHERQYTIEYGRIGDAPFARCADSQVASGRGTGKVVYLGKLSPSAPRRIEIEYATYPSAPEHALTCEAIARSFHAQERAMMATPGDAATIDSPLVDAATGSAGSDALDASGPWVFPSQHNARARFTPDGLGGEVQVTFSGITGAGLRLTFEPLTAGRTQLPPRVALQGPVLVGDDPADAPPMVYAFGGDARYLRLWGDAVYVRVDHGPQPAGRSATQRRVTYHGHLGRYRVRIDLHTADGNGVTLAELEYYLHQARLATAAEIIEPFAQASWLKDIIDAGGPAFPLFGGADVTDALVIDDRNRPAISSQFDAETGEVFTAYPPLDVDALADYEQWDSDDAHASLLGRIERLEDLAIRPVDELQRDHEPGRLAWYARTDAGRLGMTVHLEPHRATDDTLLTPILDDGGGRIQFRLGRRVIRPSDPPEVTYRELRNLRVWRIKMAPMARQELARCHYLAILPEHMLVISVTYRADTPEQLEAFDASVATLVYQDGQPLAPADPDGPTD